MRPKVESVDLVHYIFIIYPLSLPSCPKDWEILYFDPHIVFGRYCPHHLGLDVCKPYRGTGELDEGRYIDVGNAE